VNARKLLTTLTVATKLNNEIIMYRTAFSRSTKFHSFRKFRFGGIYDLLHPILTQLFMPILLYTPEAQSLTVTCKTQPGSPIPATKQITDPGYKIDICLVLWKSLFTTYQTYLTTIEKCSNSH
jgi:hypothetical protein